MNLGYVVIEWNQASHRPRLADDDLYDEKRDAEQSASEFAERTARIGRRERYTIATVEEEPS